MVPEVVEAEDRLGPFVAEGLWLLELLGTSAEALDKPALAPDELEPSERAAG